VYRNLKFLLESYGSKEPAYFGPEKDKQKWLKWLKKLNHEVHEDGSVSVDRDISLCSKNLTRIPFNFNNVEGYFFCTDNKLTSLQGVPKIVKGDFLCFGNKITSLQGVPNCIKGYFDCSSNNLTTLEGSPDSVEGYFDCSFNNITSLKGAPSFIGGDFYCSDNPLKSLEGAPEVIKGEFDSDQFTDQEYREFVKKRKYVDNKLDKELNVDLGDFS
jgi:hypothetical protein